MFSHYSSFIPLVLVLFVCGTFVTLCVTVTNILYLRLWKMSYTIYAANGKVSHIHRRMCEWDYTIDKLLICLQSERIVICVCLCIVVSNTLCCVFLHLAYLLLPVYLDCPFGILQHLFTKQATQTPLKTEVHSSAPEGLAVHNLYLECNARLSLMFIYIYILSYYKLFLYFNLCPSVMSDSLPCHLHLYPFLLQAVPLL